MATSILLFEDNDLLRESIVNMLSINKNFIVAGAFGRVTHVTDLIKKLTPDIILMDIDMPGMSGIESVKEIRNSNCLTPILMITVFDDNTHVFDAICAGASGYLLKKHLSVKLFDALEELQSGGAPMSPSVARMVISAMHQKPSQTNPYRLTAREHDVLSSLSKGSSYKLIAAELELSLDTIRTHIKSIYEKLHVHSQTEAVAKALNEKLVANQRKG
ncbi:MAG: response regulator transcription factor [Bacteroidetes bacterium]|nr:response regulator transcription factor [Bacteroidota bacterium]